MRPLVLGTRVHYALSCRALLLLLVQNYTKDAVNCETYKGLSALCLFCVPRVLFRREYSATPQKICEPAQPGRLPCNIVSVF